MLDSMSHFVQKAFIFAAIAVIALIVATSEAHAQITAGAVIPLDLGKATDSTAISKMVNTCMTAESLVSFVAKEPNSTLVLRGTATSTKDEDGDAAAWTRTASWYPQGSAKMTFDEWSTPTNSIKRSIDIGFKTEIDYYDPTRQTVFANVSTNAGGKSVAVRLKLELILPHFEIVIAGGQTCSVNNWGTDTCDNIPEALKEANLVIPADFVSASYWVNDSTEHKTQKLFDTFKYAECLQNAWSAL